MPSDVPVMFQWVEAEYAKGKVAWEQDRDSRLIAIGISRKIDSEAFLEK